jgi:hypothetical protein
MERSTLPLPKRIARRVGRNELATIDVWYQLVDAQQQHYARANNGEPRYALKFIGDNDGHDGLFSSESGEQSVSPLDALIASAGVENGTATSHDPYRSTVTISAF